MAIKQNLWKNALHLQSIQEKILPIIFLQFQSTKHFVDRVSADYNGYYIQEPSKSDKYGFIWYLSEKFPMSLDVFVNSSTKFEILSRFSLSNFKIN